MTLRKYWVESEDLSTTDRTRPETFTHRGIVHEPVYLAADVDAALRKAKAEGLEESAGLWCAYCLRGDTRRSWSHHTNGNVCTAERVWIAQAKEAQS
jgi:hypothetical protein